MCQCVELLLILWSGRLFFNSYMMRAATKDGKVLIDELQINTGGIIYTRRSSLMHSYMRSVSTVTLPDLKKYYTPPRELFHGNKWV